MDEKIDELVDAFMDAIPTLLKFRYYDLEFLKFINYHQYSIETIEFYHGYNKVIVKASLVDKNGNYNF